MVAFRAFLAASLLCLTLALAAPAEEVARGKIAKAGKAATAMVVGKLRGVQGSAFCIHPSGVFLTNEHVIREEGAVTLVLNPGGKAARVFSVKVLRSDATLDLALLRVEGEKDLPTLDLAADNKLAETDEVIAFGFPFGEQLAVSRMEFPAVSVNVGKVTSLREKDGELHRIQLDAVLNPGNSGGPVLDKEGKVAGVVVSGVAGAGVNFAIPVTHVHRFLARPEIVFDAPAVRLAAVHDPVEFQARVLSFAPGAKEPELELVLKPADGPARRVEMKLTGGAHRASAAPFPPSKEPPRYRLTAVYPRGAIHGEVADHEFKVGGTAVKLGSVRRILGGPQPRVWVGGSRVLRGPLTGIDSLPIALGDTQVSLDLGKVKEARLRPPLTFGPVAATVVARSGGKEVGRLTRFVEVQGVAAEGRPELFLDLEVAPLEKDAVVRKLDGYVSDVAVGGGGRYLILHMAGRGKLAVFDVNAAKVVKELPVGGAGMKFAATLDKLVVALPGTRTLQRWDLNTFELDRSVEFPWKGELLGLAAGCASDGPILVLAKDNNTFQIAPFTLDLDKFTRREIAWALGEGWHHPIHGNLLHLRASPDGTSFASWCTSHSPSGMHWFHLTGSLSRRTYSHQAAGHVLPGLGGKVLYTGLGAYTPYVKGMGQEPRRHPAADPEGRYVPGHHGDYCLYLGKGPTYRDRNPPRTLEVHKLGVAKPLIRLSEAAIFLEDEQNIRHDFTMDKRFHLIPDAKLLVVIPPGNDRLALYRVDPQAAEARLAGEK